MALNVLLVILTVSIIVLLANVSTLWKEIHGIRQWIKNFADACVKFQENEQEIAKHIRAVESVLNMAIQRAKEEKEKEGGIE